MDLTTTSPASGYSARSQPIAYHSTASPSKVPEEPYRFEPFGDDGLTFEDILDVINPLQHIPIISTLYREWTDDQIDPIPRIAGGALFGGWMGAISSLVNMVVDEITGSDVGEHVLAFATDLLGIDDSEPSEMYAGAISPPEGDADTVPLEIASGGRPSPAPVPTSLEVLEWPHLTTDPAADTLQALKTVPTVGVLENRMASVRQGHVTDLVVLAMSMYEKGERSDTQRVTPRIDVLS